MVHEVNQEINLLKTKNSHYEKEILKYEKMFEELQLNGNFKSSPSNKIIGGI
jgi:hypothetical protein